MVEDQRVKTHSPTEKSTESNVREAADWLLANRERCTSRVIPTLKQRFDLSTREAISAAQMAHALQFGGV